MNARTLADMVTEDQTDSREKLIMLCELVVAYRDLQATQRELDDAGECFFRYGENRGLEPYRDRVARANSRVEILESFLGVR